MFEDERQKAKFEVGKHRLSLKLALLAVHRKTASLLQSLEADADVFIGLQTLRSETNEVFTESESLERALDRLGLLERLIIVSKGAK